MTSLGKMTSARATALQVLFVSGLLTFIAIVGAIGGAIVGVLLLVVSSPLWVAHVAAHPGSEDVMLTVAIGGGGLCGAAVCLALIARLALAPQPVHGDQ